MDLLENINVILGYMTINQQFFQTERSLIIFKMKETKGHCAFLAEFAVFQCFSFFFPSVRKTLSLMSVELFSTFFLTAKSGKAAVYISRYFSCSACRSRSKSQTHKTTSVKNEKGRKTAGQVQNLCQTDWGIKKIVMPPKNKMVPKRDLAFWERGEQQHNGSIS